MRGVFIFEQLKFNLIKALVDLERIQDSKKLIEIKTDLLNKKEEYINGQIEGGRMIYEKASEVDIDRINVEKKLNELTFDEEAVRFELVNLVGYAPNIKSPKVERNEWNENFNTILPILAENEELKSAKSLIKASKAKFRPSYGVSALYKSRESGDNFDGDDWFSANLKFSVPLWWYNNQSPNLKSARANYDSRNMSRSAKIRNWQQKIDTLNKNIYRTEKNIDFLEKKEASVKELVRTVTAKYESGNIGYDQLINAQLGKVSIDLELLNERAKLKNLIAQFNSYVVSIDNKKAE